MADTLRLRVVTPEGSRVDEEAASVTVRSEVGELCLLPQHRPILAALLPGRLVLERAGGEREIFAIDRGFLEGGPDCANVITERCVGAGELNPEDAARLEVSGSDER